MSRRRTELLVTILGLTVVVLAGVNLTAVSLRADLTEDRIYTLSEQSRAALDRLDDPLSITYYRSSRLAQVSPRVDEIEDFLAEYRSVAPDTVTLSIVDPVDDATRRAAAELGLTPFEVQVPQDGGLVVAEVFSGIVVRYRAALRTIPEAFDLSMVEYDLTQAVRSLLGDTDRQVAVLIGDDRFSRENDFRLLWAQLSRAFDVVEVLPGDFIPSVVDVLVVLGGRDLAAQDISPIRNFIELGGSALLAVNGVQVDFQDSLEAVPSDSPIVTFLATLGFDVDDRLLLDVDHLALPRAGGGGTSPYPHWISVTADRLASAHPISLGFAGLDLYWPSALTGMPPQAEVLVRSTASAVRMGRPIVLDPEASVDYLATAPLSGPLPLAAAHRLPVSDDTGAQGARLVVVGDAEFTSDLMLATDSRHNAVFLENAVEWLAGDEDLIAVRTRGRVDRRLMEGVDPDTRGRLARRITLVAVVLLPGAFALAGLVHLVRRRRRASSSD